MDDCKANDSKTPIRGPHSDNEYVNDYFLEQGEPSEQVVADWRLLVTALEKREATLAVALMQAHVFRFRKMVQGLKENGSSHGRNTRTL